jgi:RimJ/RimL family protein N-acetyltransferase
LKREIFLETERIYFRQFRADEARLLFGLDRDAEVMRFISKGQPTSLSRIEKDILPRFLAYYAIAPPQGFWAAHLRSNEEFIGWFHLRPDKIEPAEMELGYRLRVGAWGRGLATEGSRALIERGFREWNYEKISARTLTVNAASRRVMEKAGLKFECEFLWSAQAMPEWSEDERRGVKYGLSRQEFLLTQT